MKIRYLIDEVAYDDNGLIISMKHVGEVIRCKDCAKKELCSIFRDARQELGFCAWAEREEE